MPLSSRDCIMRFSIVYVLLYRSFLNSIKVTCSISRGNGEGRYSQIFYCNSVGSFHYFNCFSCYSYIIITYSIPFMHSFIDHKVRATAACVYVCVCESEWMNGWHISHWQQQQKSYRARCELRYFEMNWVFINVICVWGHHKINDLWNTIPKYVKHNNTVTHLIKSIKSPFPLTSTILHLIRQILKKFLFYLSFISLALIQIKCGNKTTTTKKHRIQMLLFFFNTTIISFFSCPFGPDNEYLWHKI